MPVRGATECGNAPSTYEEHQTGITAACTQKDDPESENDAEEDENEAFMMDHQEKEREH